MHWCLKLFLLSGVNRLKTSFGWTKLNLKKKKIQKRLQTDRTTKCTNCYLLIIGWHYVLIYQCDKS